MGMSITGVKMGLTYHHNQSDISLENSLKTINSNTSTHQLSMFSLWAEKLPDALLLLNNQGQVLAINQKACRLIKKSQQTLLGSDFSKELNLTKKQLLSRLKHCSRSRTPIKIFNYTTPGLHEQTGIDCEGFLFEPAIEENSAHILLRLNQTNLKTNQFIALNREIEKQRVITKKLLLSKESLRKSEEKLSTTLCSIGDAVIATNIHGIIEYMNPVAEKLTGWQIEDAINQQLETVFCIVNETTRHTIDNPIKHCIENNKTAKLDRDIILINHSGKELAIEDTASPIRSKDGNITGAVLVFRDVSEARELAAEICYQSIHDTLTKLINRGEFERRLNIAIKKAAEKKANQALLYIDLDQFKIVNDTCGHIAGDELLRQISSLLSQSLRETDTLARLGGDEFGVLLENCPLKKAAEISQHICEKVSQHHFVWDTQPFSVGASIGVIPITHESGTMANIMSAVDLACYAAKEKGRNCIHVADLDDEEIVIRKGELRWLTRIKQAVAQDQFSLYYQNIVNINQAEKSFDHVEILIRLKDSEKFIPPGAFIPAAERYNLMPDIDRWVIKSLFKHCHLNRTNTENSNRVFSINLSGASIIDLSLIDYILKQQEIYNISTSQICFEITETAAIANLTNATNFIKSLKSEGYTFALDDFGSGMSSFAYLKNLPVDYLKIDGSFVKGIANDAIDYAMVKSINEIGQTMGLKTIAEFVENKEIYDKLSEIGIDYVQGYHCHKPEPI